MKVGFTGTRTGMTLAQEVTFVRLIVGCTVFRHGSCIGSDVRAAFLARETLGRAVQIHAHPGPVGNRFMGRSMVDDVRHTAKPFLARSRDIVKLCEVLIACPQEEAEQPRGGTWHTIREARRMGKAVYVIMPDGSLLEEVRT